jgi:hypothetical protein
MHHVRRSQNERIAMVAMALVFVVLLLRVGDDQLQRRAHHLASNPYDEALRCCWRLLGQFVCVANENNNFASAFRLNLATRALTLAAGSPFPGRQWR